MGTLPRILPLFALLGAAAAVRAADPAANLAPGSPAPALNVKRWVKGQPVTRFDPKKLYVVEFWATWCGPCKTSIPHLSELAKKNRDVTFVGVSIWEDDTKEIDRFVTEMGDKMAYNVAYSGNQDGMAETWMKPFAQNGIPAAFVVKGGKVVWVGHPMEMEEPLAQIKTGKFDAAGFKKKFDAQAEETRQQMAMNKEIGGAQKLFGDGKRDEAKAALAQAEAKYPKMASTFESIRFGWLATEDPVAWEAKANEMAATKDPQKLQALASFGLSRARKPETRAMGLKATEIALKASERKDFDVLWYAYNTYKQTEDTQLALDAVNDLLVLFPTSEAKDMPDFKAQLEKERAELQAKVGNK